MMSNEVPQYTPELIESDGNVVLQVPEWVSEALGGEGDLVVANSLDVDSERQRQLIGLIIGAAAERDEMQDKLIERHVRPIISFYGKGVQKEEDIPGEIAVTEKNADFDADLVVFGSLVSIWNALQDRDEIGQEERAFLRRYGVLFEQMKEAHSTRWQHTQNVGHVRGIAAWNRYVGTPSQAAIDSAAEDEELDYNKRVREWAEDPRNKLSARAKAKAIGGDDSVVDIDEAQESDAAVQARDLISTHRSIVDGLLSGDLRIGDEDEVMAVIVQDLHHYKGHDELAQVGSDTWDRILAQSRAALGSRNAVAASASHMVPRSRPATLEGGPERTRYYSGRRPAPREPIEKESEVQSGGRLRRAIGRLLPRRRRSS